MNRKSSHILEYLSRHRIEDHLMSASLIELPNTEGIDDLYHDGYITVGPSRAGSIRRVSITGKGLDWVKANLKVQHSNISVATIKDDIIALSIKAELYAHIETYLKNEDYYHAVEESYKHVRERLKTLTRSEIATKAFGYDANTPIDYVKIFGHEPVDDIEKDFLKGIRFLHLAVQFLRNEKSHSLATVLDKNLALHYISIASLAYDLISRPRTEVEQ